MGFNRQAGAAFGLVAAIVLAVLAGGCVSKSKADAQARAAFMAGQQMALQQAQARGPGVTFVGPVRNTFIPWTMDLTLAKAIVAADWFGRGDPTEIILMRDGQQTQLDPKKLLEGDDIPLQPRDVVELK